MQPLLIGVRGIARTAGWVFVCGLLACWCLAEGRADEQPASAQPAAQPGVAGAPPAAEQAGDHRAGEEHAAEAHDAHPAEGPMTAHKEEADLALWTLITFVVFMSVLGKFAWKPLIQGLDQRERAIFAALSEAEASRTRSQKLLEDYQSKIDRVQGQVREILAEARRDAELTKNEIIATAQREAEATQKRAIIEIERARDSALDELFDHMSRTVSQATQQVVGRSLTGEDHERLIRESLQGFAARRA